MTYVPAVGTLTWFDRSGNALGTVGEPGEYDHLALSADETRLAVSKRHGSAEASVWVFELPRASARRITHGQEDTNLLRWSPDRQRLMFSAVRDSAFNVLLQTTVDGSGQPELLLNPGIVNWLNDWSRNGRFVLYAVDSRTTRGDLWILPLTGEKTPKPFLNSPAHEGGGAFSPNGQWVAYTSTVSGRSEIHVSSFPEAGAQRQISTSGGFNPVWRDDGRELFFVGPGQMLMSARLNGNEVSDVKPLFRLPLAAGGRWHQYTVNRDGSRILAIVPEPQTQPKSVTVVANWPGLLNAR
jgi:Tol biopolymer transport system component